MAIANPLLQKRRKVNYFLFFLILFKRRLIYLGRDYIQAKLVVIIGLTQFCFLLTMKINETLNYMGRTNHFLKRISFLAMVAFTFFSCSDYVAEFTIQNGHPPILFTGQIVQENETRANDYGFVEGDRMGIYVVDRNQGVAGTLESLDNRAQNVLYKLEENGQWTSPTTIYWRDRDTHIDIYGYYPGVNFIENPTAYSFEVQTDQSTEAANGTLGGYEQSDLLWGKATDIGFTTETIIVRYNHILAGVRVILNKGTGISNTEWEKLEKIVLVNNTVLKGNVDLSQGSVTLGEQRGSIRMLPQSNDNYRAVVLPQTVEAGKQLLSITLDGQTYAHTLDATMKYQAGKLHNFTMTVNKCEASGDYEISVTSDGISPWVNDESSHKFSAMAYLVVHCPEPGKLEEGIVAAGYDIQTVQNLKVTGSITNADFDLMRERMPMLRNLNLKEARVKHAVTHFDNFKWEDEVRDDVLPHNAFWGNKTIRSLVLPSVLSAVDDGALANMQLMNSTLEIPEGVTRIGTLVCYNNEHNGVTLILPNRLDSIGSRAFDFCRYNCEFNFPDNIKYIGFSVFWAAENFHGIFHYPSQLQHLGEGAFYGLGRENGEASYTGELEIPQGISVIPEGYGPHLGNRIDLKIPQGVRKISVRAFAAGNKYRSLQLPEGIVEIAESAFSNNFNMPFPISFPNTLVSIGNYCFAYAGIEGELAFPKSCVSIGEWCFAGNHITKLTFSDQMTTISAASFRDNDQLAYVCLPRYLEYIEESAFAYCGAIQTIVCLNPEPPLLGNRVFEGIYFDKCILQVPEGAVETYRRAAGWNQFQNITPYRELAVNIPDVTTLNKGMKREGIIRAESDWEVTECPSWCTVDPMQGSNKAEVAITVHAQPKGAPDREGRVAFKLKDKDYTVYIPIRQLSYEYGEDETVVLQTASSGAPKAVPLFIVGDGYNAQDIQSGKYLQEMREQMEYLFSCEPYKTYRNYFTVSTAIAVSPESGIPTFFGSPLGDKTRFNSEVIEGEFKGSDWRIWDYAQQYGSDISYEREGQTTIMVLLNTNALANKTYLSSNGRSISYLGKSTDVYPYDQRDYVLREVGGVGFGKLAAEHIIHFTFIKSCGCGFCNEMPQYYSGKELGWYENVSVSGRMNEVPWSHLIFHENYSKYVDMYEGAWKHARGIYRSEEQSVMSTYIPYYNAISREAIARRILEYSGEGYTFEKFLERDKREYPGE